MSENLLKNAFQPIETQFGASMRALSLFLQIEQHHGTDAAREIFANLGKPLSKRQIMKRRKFALLQRIDDLPDGNVSELARRILEENTTLPLEDQMTPRGSTSFPTVYHYLLDLIKERETAIAKGTWDGPPWEWSHPREDDL
ncbi:MAG TPA: hypothetical protein VIQ05_23185 [Tardiphaga sp.]